MLGRQVTFRIAVGVPQLQSRTYSVAQPRQLTTLLRRVNSKAVRHNIRDTTFVQRRSYAGTSEDNVGEPSKRVKRAVKKDASTDSGKSSSKRSVAARKKKDAPKKTKAGKGSSNASPVKKAAKPPRELNDEQQLARKIKELKAAALSPPINSFRAVSAYNEFVGEYTAKKRSEFSPSSENESFSAKNLLKEASETFRKITPAELEHYNHLANAKTRQREEAISAWLDSLSPEEIRVANNARKQLRVILSKQKKKVTMWRPLRSDRLVKRPIPAYTFFLLDRYASGDLRHIASVDAAKLVSQEWRALTASEKQKYEDMAAEDRTRYFREFEETYGHKAYVQEHPRKESSPEAANASGSA
ncbi:hypothetical protein H2203_003143 [Taxawa tesnikishii (nom. ined.)]|nr:hypothetical protein H2203_003143 [Dothideales sp. JES 119]